MRPRVSPRAATMRAPCAPRRAGSSATPRCVVRVDADHVVVEVSRSVAPPGALARWGAVHLHADATALVEETP